MSRVYTQSSFELNGHRAWLYLLESDLGPMPVVDYETPRSMELVRKVFPWGEDYEKATRYYKKVCTKLMNELMEVK